MPSSSQEKGIDLILYHRHSKKILTIQVKSSKTYFNDDKQKPRTRQYSYYLWLNRFEVQETADYYFLIGIYPNVPLHVDKEKQKEVNVNLVKWEPVILVFTNSEMKDFLDSVKQKKQNKPDKMFAFGFDNSDEIYQVRGCPEHINMDKYLFKNRIQEIKDKLGH
ncbi:MAG: hypothetical protein AB7V07_02660 [Candidatus Delongbacteria bacterium]